MVNIPQIKFSAQTYRRLILEIKDCFFKLKTIFSIWNWNIRVPRRSILLTAEDYWGRVDWLLGVSPPGKVFTFIKWPKEALGWTLFSNTQILELSQQGYFPAFAYNLEWLFEASRKQRRNYEKIFALLLIIYDCSSYFQNLYWRQFGGKLKKLKEKENIFPN